ncbi:MAG: M23 family metallopeptidase [Eubacteriales bacterium]|nr:M23 family metallopeptidase [Eubacteriales bacterium]
MSGTNGRRARHFFGGTGFYIALFLCVTALAVAGYWTLLPKNNTSADTQVSAAAPITIPDETTPVMPEVDPPEPVRPVQQIEEIPAPVDIPVSDVVPVEPHLIVSPLTGETIAAFSVDTLAYNETLGDWRTHDGIDIAANVGTPVLAACSGTVTAVKSDDLLGTCVTITHDGGYESTYANLQSVPTVGEGQYISAGQVIGSVGTTSLIESSSAPHLHFSVSKDGTPIDPTEFLK